MVRAQPREQPHQRPRRRYYHPGLALPPVQDQVSSARKPATPPIQTRITSSNKAISSAYTIGKHSSSVGEILVSLACRCLLQ
ncbi:hypothetical protein VTL71DRAFT_8265, partial [Oculimacula yallundae]